MSRSQHNCPKCGTALPSTATEGLCPRCLFAQLEQLVPPGSAEVPSTAATDSDRQREFGDYELAEEIGQGGMGVVYRARQVSLNRPVAVKVIKPGLDTRRIMARFEAERQALALMDHPGIARVIDAGATRTGRPYFVMELVRGVRITDYCRQRELSVNERLPLFIEVCRAVQHAHQKGVIHRDLKPSNILVTELDGRPLPKIIDFGIAKATEGRLGEETLFTVAGQFLGTPAYLSPEQAEWGGVDIDTRSDIYSLGVLLYELLTGHLPFEPGSLAKGSLEEMHRAIREMTPLRPSTCLRRTGAGSSSRSATHPLHVATDLDWIVMKCLEKDRTRRYETANGLAMDIERHLNQEPIVARPPSRLYEFRKTVRRHKFGFLATGAVIIALVSGLAGVMWQWRRAVAAEEQAGRERDHAQLLAAKAALERGQSKLEEGNSLGLFDLVEAFGLSKQDPLFQETVGRRWATWHAEWEQRTLAVRAAPGITSPDHLRAVTLADWPPLNTSHEISVLDTLTGERLFGPLQHESAVKSGAFSPDGEIFAAVTENGAIHLWDATTGQPVRPSCETGITNLNAVLFSPDRSLLAAFVRSIECPGSTRVALLRLNRPGDRAHVLERHGYPVERIQFSPDGEILAVLCAPDLQLWRTATLQPVGPPVAVGYSGPLEFDADGTRLAFSRVGARGIGLLDPRTQEIVQSLSTGSVSPSTVSFSHDGSLLATSGNGLNVNLYRTTDLATEPYVQQKTGRRTQGRLSFNANDSRLAAGDVAGTVRVMRTSDGSITHALHVLPFANACFLNNGILAATASGEAVFWDLTATPLPGNSLSDDAQAYSLAFDRSGELLAVGGEHEVRLWRMGTPPRREGVVPLPGRVLALTYPEAGNRFVAFSEDGSLTAVEPRTGSTTLLTHIDRGHEVTVHLSPDARRLALLGSEEALLIDTQNGGFNWLRAEVRVGPAAFRGDSAAMAVGLGGWNLRLYDVTATAPSVRTETRNLGGGIAGLACHPTSGLVAINLEGREIRLYDLEQSRQLSGPYASSLERVERLRFSPDGSLLAAAGQSHEGGEAVELWHVDLRVGLARAGSILPAEQEMRSMVFSPDNRTLACAGLGSTRLWYLPSAPKALEAVQSQTRATLGFRLDEHGNPVLVSSPINDVEQIRARLTQDPPPVLTPLDAALNLPPPEALAALQRLSDEHPGERVYGELQSHLHLELMHANGRRGQLPEALEHAGKAVRLGCDDPFAHALRALLMLQVGDIEGYRTSCRSMNERYKGCDDPVVVRYLTAAMALGPGALENYDELIGHAERSLRLASRAEDPGCRFQLGAVLIRAERYEKAATELQSVYQHQEEHGAARGFDPIELKLLLAVCQAHLGHLEAARKWFDAAEQESRSVFGRGQGMIREPWWLKPILTLRKREAEAALSALASRSTSPE